MYSMNTLITTCSKCGGSGQTKLPTYLSEMLTVIPPQGMTSRELSDLFKVNIQAMVNRLSRLEKMGFLRREIGVHPSGGQEATWYRTTC